MAQVDELEKRFDQHLAIYAANGKESKRVADALERMIENSKERDIKVDEMYQFFNDGKAATKVTKLVFGLLMAVGAAYLMIKNILKV